MHRSFLSGLTFLEAFKISFKPTIITLELVTAKKAFNIKTNKKQYYKENGFLVFIERNLLL